MHKFGGCSRRGLHGAASLNMMSDMSHDDEDESDDLLKTIEMKSVDPTAEVEALLGELDDLLKNGDVGAALAAKGINGSVALLASQGLAAYLRGKKAEAADDLQAAAEEIKDRLALSASTRGTPN